MKKFLVPTDFSDTSKNAARFAVQAVSNEKDATIILYNLHDVVAAGSDGSLLTETENDRIIVLTEALHNLKDELLTLAPSAKIEIVLEGGSSLVDSLDRYVRHHGIDLVLMGITGATRLEQIFMGSNTLNLVDKGICPVMIIPPDATYHPIRNIALASDLKEVETTTPIAAIKGVLKIFNASLHVVNVDSEHYVDITDEYKAERAKLEKMFAGYNPEFYFIRQYDFQEAISQFSLDRAIDAIIIVPKRNSFLSGLFKTSHTKKLAYHSHIPIVAIHE
ncbi:MAG: universal stress protein [Pseudobacter sp.]|uniref:universal stress protein n=1 Tax=Pseudobacter sp. TaxID=2045420 RepID=UPI003F7FEBDB